MHDAVPIRHGWPAIPYSSVGTLTPARGARRNNSHGARRDGKKNGKKMTATTLGEHFWIITVLCD